MDAMTYEGFMRGAFGILDNTLIERGGDPARLANADIFNFGSIEEVKTGAAYGIGIYNSHIFNNCLSISDEDQTALRQSLSGVINSSNKDEIIVILKNYRTIKDRLIRGL